MGSGRGDLGNKYDPNLASHRAIRRILQRIGWKNGKTERDPGCPAPPPIMPADPPVPNGLAEPTNNEKAQDLWTILRLDDFWKAK